MSGRANLPECRRTPPDMADEIPAQKASYAQSLRSGSAAPDLVASGLHSLHAPADRDLGA